MNTNVDYLKKRLNEVNNSKDLLSASEPKEISIVTQLFELLVSRGFIATNTHHGGENYNLPNTYTRGQRQLAWRFVDSLFFGNPEVLDYTDNDVIITDNVPLIDVTCQQLSVLPEFWHIYKCNLLFQDCTPTAGYNCFMNRIGGDRSQVFYELIRRNILDKGIVSFNCWRPGDGHKINDIDYTVVNYNWQYAQADLFRYEVEHQKGMALIPYCSINESNGLAQCVIDSNVSLVLETYTSDSHIVFSEKIFRALQLPRPWLLYCSPGSIALLKQHGFDVLDDYADVSYDNIIIHGDRLQAILDQLESFITRKYTEQDYQRFAQAASHNQTLLATFAHKWPMRFDEILNRIKEL
jgi:hypothetical protein